MIWVLKPGFDERRLGLLPSLLCDDRPAAQQLNDRYIGGWSPNPFRKHNLNTSTGELSYPNDPPLLPDAIAIHAAADEILMLYPHDWLVILQPDGSWEIDRVD